MLNVVCCVRVVSVSVCVTCSCIHTDINMYGAWLSFPSPTHIVQVGRPKLDGSWHLRSFRSPTAVFAAVFPEVCTHDYECGRSVDDWPVLLVCTE